MLHRSRAAFAGNFPCHVTLKTRPALPSLRSVKVVRELEKTLAATSDRGDFRVAHYSLQDDHVHLIVEATDRFALGRGMRSIEARLVRAVNRAGRVREPAGNEDLVAEKSFRSMEESFRAVGPAM